MNDFNRWYLTSDVPESVKFRIFSMPHWLYLLASVIITVVLMRAVKKHGRKFAEIVIYTLCFLAISIYFYRFYMYSIYYAYYRFVDNLPLHLCTISSFAMPAAIITKNKILNNYCYSVLLPGAILAMLTPAEMFMDYFYLGWFPLFFFIWHLIIVLIPILSIAAGLFRPNIKEFPAVVVISIIYMAVVYPLNKVLNTNYLFINTPSRGSLLETFYIWCGSPGYLVPTFAAFVAIVFLMYVPWIIYDYRQKQKKAN